MFTTLYRSTNLASEDVYRASCDIFILLAIQIDARGCLRGSLGWCRSWVVVQLPTCGSDRQLVQQDVFHLHVRLLCSRFNVSVVLHLGLARLNQKETLEREVFIEDGEGQPGKGSAGALPLPGPLPHVGGEGLVVGQSRGGDQSKELGGVGVELLQPCRGFVLDLALDSPTGP